MFPVASIRDILSQTRNIFDKIRNINIFVFFCVNVEVAGMLGKLIKRVKSSCYNVTLWFCNVSVSR